VDASGLIQQIQELLKQIPDIRNERQAIGSSKVKAWKTQVEQNLRLGGKNTSKLLQNFQNLKFGAGAMGSEAVGSSEVKFQAYQAELDAAEKLLKNAVQTIQIFGVSEEQKLPDWFKQELKASGLIKIGAKEVDIRTVTVQEFFSAILALTESDKSLDESLKEEIRSHIRAISKHPLLQPFLNQTLDKPFGKL
jgi:hypothetical protein